MSNPFFQAFLDVIDLFENIENKFGFKYILVGGLLTPIYAESRQTQDIDVVIQIQITEENKEILKRVFNDNNFHPLISWEDTFIDWKTLKFIQFLDKSEIIKIDLNFMDPSSKHLTIHDTMKKISFENRKRLKIQNIPCWATSREDFILSKLVYGGYQDYKDALACWVRYYEELDMKYLEENARNLNVENQFQNIVQKITASDVFSDDA
ncbi:MAG: hypothetical protein JW776_12055 [Candidatus Lokiarchaeota archaeon]|nr:hypothetical protein [Candidatus Lokiarchaeota archaeon]